MNKLISNLSHFGLLILCLLFGSAFTHCVSSSEGMPFPAQAWTGGSENVGQLVSGVCATIVGDKVKITYDLAQDADVWVVPSFDNCMSYCGALQCVTGNVGSDVRKGSRKWILWNYKAEQDSMSINYPFDIDNVKLKVIADLPVAYDTTPMVVWAEGTQSLVNPVGEVVVEPGKYSAIMEEYYCGTVPNFIPIPVKDHNGKWGMIDHWSNVVIPCKYSLLYRYNPFLYIAMEDDLTEAVGQSNKNGSSNENDSNNGIGQSNKVNKEGNTTALVLSNRGKVLGKVNDLESILDRSDAIKTCDSDTVGYSFALGKRNLLVRDIYIGKSGEVYSGDLCVRAFKDLAFYPLRYTDYPKSNLVTEGCARIDCRSIPERGFEPLDQILDVNGKKVYFIDYMKDDSREDYDYYYRKGSSVYSFRLPKGVSPYKGDGSYYTQYLLDANIVKAVDESTGLLGVYDYGGSRIIPCQWTEIDVHLNDDHDPLEGFVQVNYYHCRKADNTGQILIPIRDVDHPACYHAVAYTNQDRITKFANSDTQHALNPDGRSWRLHNSYDNAHVITLRDDKNETLALLDHQGKLLTDKVETICWIDFNTCTRLLGLIMDGETAPRYFDVETGRFVDCLRGAKPCGYIPSHKYCMRKGNNTVVYDAETEGITYCAKGKVPVNEYQDNRIILEDNSGHTYLADSTLTNIFLFDNLQVSEANRFSEGLCWVKEKDRSWLIINEEGKTVTPSYSKHISFGKLFEFHNGLCRIEKNGKYGYADQNGRIVIPCIYQDAEDFDMGYALVSDDGVHWGVINRHGAVKRPCVYISKMLAKYNIL